VDFNDPEGEGLPGSRNFFLESEPGVRVGVWQILPAELAVSRVRVCPAHGTSSWILSPGYGSASGRFSLLSWR
jgi:hypothetical protein